MLETIHVQELADVAGDEELRHLVCCVDDVAMCGSLVADCDWELWNAAGNLPCVVCAELDEVGCPRCGE